MSANAAALKKLLKDPSLVETRAYVNGEWWMPRMALPST